MVNIAADPNFDARFESIVQRWYMNGLTQEDRTYLSTTRVTVDEFDELTEQVKHGVELVNYHIELTECTTDVQEYLSGMFDSWIRNAYGHKTSLVLDQHVRISLSITNHSYCLCSRTCQVARFLIPPPLYAPTRPSQSPPLSAPHSTTLSLLSIRCGRNARKQTTSPP